jgi:hypothetical protein
MDIIAPQQRKKIQGGGRSRKGGTRLQVHSPSAAASAEQSSVVGWVCVAKPPLARNPTFACDRPSRDAVETIRCTKRGSAAVAHGGLQSGPPNRTSKCWVTRGIRCRDTAARPVAALTLPTICWKFILNSRVIRPELPKDRRSGIEDDHLPNFADRGR